MLQKIKAEIVLWTAGFVLLTLIINAPLLPFFLRVSGLAKGASPFEVTYCFWLQLSLCWCAAHSYQC